MDKRLSEIQKKINGNDVIIDVVSLSTEYHPAANSASFLILKIVGNSDHYVIPINCYDFEFNFQLKDVENFFKLLSCKVYCFSKKKILHLIHLNNLIDLSLYMFLKTGETIDEDDYFTASYDFYRKRYPYHKELNKIIPMTNHVSKFLDICKDIEPYVFNKIDSAYDNINISVIETLKKIESVGLAVNLEEFSKHFGDKMYLVSDNKVYTEYNLLTSTGRPSNRFGGINYAALNKENECRKSFVSRHGEDGMLVMFDYSAYHPHIIAKLINYNFPTGINIYEYLGKYYFDKETLTDEELKMSKTITFQQLYGSISDTYKQIPYFKKITEYIHHRWQYFNEYGYVETPIFKRQISSNHLKNANPTKLFNYILQASETEYSMIGLMGVTQYLEHKHTKAILYTYDSILFDVHKNDGKQMILDIKSLMEQSGFPTKCYIGYNYHDMKHITF